MNPADALAALRARLHDEGLDAWLAPRADAYLGEHLDPADERLARITGFTGSAGVALVGRDQALLFVDGRYTIQARQDVGAAYEVIQSPPVAMAARIRDTLAMWHKPARVGFDPALHAHSAIQRLRAALGDTARLIPHAANLIDTDWHDRPKPKRAPWRPHPRECAGRASQDKRQALSQALAQHNAKACVLTSPESIAWLLNARGSDLPCLPVGRGFALAHDDGKVALFVDPALIDAATQANFGEGVSLHQPETFHAALDALANTATLVNPHETNTAIVARLEAAKAQLIPAADPCLAPRAIKNAAEIAAARQAHAMDGATLTRFFCWFDAHQSGQDEASLAARLDAMRLDAGATSLAFETISASGPNAALAHHHPNPDNPRYLRPDDLYLVDSGGQYPQGATTDTTRTVACSPQALNPLRRDRFTRVLKGHIALARAQFPQGTPGSRLDVLARAPLWQVGLDYDHGTGHGVGAYLSVHEGPQSFSQRDSGVALREGMITSNEPGYYLEGDFGVRLENLTLVCAATTDDASRPMLMLETLTLVPFDLRVVDFSMLNTEELAWLDAYHAQIHAGLDPLLDAATRLWLEKATDLQFHQRSA